MNLDLTAQALPLFTALTVLLVVGVAALIAAHR